MPGLNFPVSEYYADHIVDGFSINRRGRWWTAILVIEEPTNGKKFMCMYRWEKKDGDWKTRKNFKINSKRDAEKLVEVVQKLTDKL